jgi:hypothetical protein
MSDHRHHLQFPKTLATFKGLPGEYGNVEVRAQSAHSMRLQLTSEYVDMNRADGQEMIRVLSAWLAAPVSRIVVDNDGEGETIVVVENRARGEGRTDVVVVEDERVERSHVQGNNDSRRPT